MSLEARAGRTTAIVLQAEGRFGIPALAPAAMNGAWILGTLALVALASWRWRPPTLGAAVLAGAGIVMFALLFAKWTTQPYYAYVGGIVACGLALLLVREQGSSA